MKEKLTSGAPLPATSRPGEAVRFHHSKPLVLRYGIAIIAVALALLLKLLLAPLLESDVPFLLFFIALVGSAIYGGLGPGLLATGLALLASDYFFVTPGMLFFQAVGHSLRLVIFGIEGAMISYISAALTRARWQAETNAREMRRQKEGVYQSEERFRLLVASVKDYAIYMLDPGGHIVSWNEGAARIKGYQAEEIIGQHFARFYPPEDQARGHPAHELEVAARIGRFEEEGWRVRKDGARFWAHVVLSAIYDEAGHLRGFAKVTRDITERKRAADMLRASEARLAAIINSAMDAIITINAAQRIEVFNTAAEQIFRCSASEAIGQPIDRFIPERFRQAHRGYIQEFGQTGTTSRSMHSPGTLVALRANGEKFPIEATIAQEEVAGQKLYTVIIRDVTERKRAEDALREREEHFRTLVQNAADMITVLDADGNIRYQSPASARILGYQPSDLLGTNAFALIHPEDLAAVQQVFQQKLQAPGTTLEIEYRCRHHDGSWRVLESTGTNLLDHPAISGVVVNSRDITEHRAAQEQLRHQAL